MVKHPLTYNQRVSLKLQKAHGILCGHADDGFKEKEQAMFREIRDIILSKKYEYEPHATFDVTKEYPDFDDRWHY